MSFPFDFGFVPSTVGDDGDPLDVLVLMDETVPVGALVPSRLIGVIQAEQTERDGRTEDNHRLIAVAEASELFADVRKLSDLPAAMTTQIEHFFISCNEQAGKRFRPTGQEGRKAARSLFEKSHRRFQKNRKR